MAEIGRPTVMTPETIAKLEEGFIKGFSDREACLYADIHPATLYRYCEDNEDFSDRKELLKEKVKMAAKSNIAEAVFTGNLSLSQWYAERKDPEFKAKSDITTNNQPLREISPEEAAKLDAILEQNKTN